MVLSTASAISPIAATSSFQEVAQALAQDQNSLRIKKLLLFACTQIWENDPQQLDQLDLPDLLNQLLAIDPTLAQLQSHIHTIANALNKSAEYTLVANAIINRVSRLYLETSPLPQAGDRPKDYAIVAQTLEREPHPLRIKKLLVLICKNVWESDVDRLNLIPFLDLVQAVHSLSPTLEGLKSVLENLVKTLSKPVEYGAIAERVCLAFQPLYAISLSKAGLATSHPKDEFTQTLAAIPHDITVTGETFTGGIEAEILPNSSHLDSIKSNPLQIHHTTQPIQQEFGYLLNQELTDLFDLRLEIIQSANPLLAKIVLFSLLHETFQPGAEHDLLLKNYELDDLLRILLQTHKLFSDLESKLLCAAKALGESAEAVRVAQAILQAVKSCYTYLPLGVGIAITHLDENATSIVSVEESLPGTTEPDPPGNYSLTPKAQTCQTSLDRATEFHALADADQRIKIQGLAN